MTDLEILTAIQAKIANTDNWCQGPSAKNSSGQPVAVDSPNATCWCLWGALLAVEAETDVLHEISDRVDKKLGAASKALFNLDYVKVNETMGHKEVMMILDSAIEKEPS